MYIFKISVKSAKKYMASVFLDDKGVFLASGLSSTFGSIGWSNSWKNTGFEEVNN